MNQSAVAAETSQGGGLNILQPGHRVLQGVAVTWQCGGDRGALSLALVVEMLQMSGIAVTDIHMTMVIIIN